MMEASTIEKQLGIIDRLVALADAGGDVSEVLGQSLDVVLGGLESGVGGALLQGQRGGDPQLVAHRGFQSEELGVLRQIAPHLAVRRASVDGAGVIPLCRDTPPGASLERLLLDMGCRSMLIIPVVGRKERLGYLFAGLGSETCCNALDQEFANTAGHIIGAAVAIREMDEQMRLRLNQSQALYEVSRALGTVLDLDHLLSLIVRLAIDTVARAQNGVLHLLDEETGELYPRALSFVSEVRPPASGQSRMRIGHGAAGYALETGSVVNIADVSRDPRFVEVGATRRFTSMLVAPLMLANRRIGTLSIDSTEPNAFSREDESLLVTLATQAASAIENARLVRDLQQSLQDLKATQARLIQSAKLSAIGQLVAGIAHELNNPLTAVMGYAELLQMDEGINQEILPDLREIYSQSQRAAKIVRNLLTFARQDQVQSRLVDINEVLRSSLEIRAYQLRLDDIKVTTQLDNRVLDTMADPSQLQHVFVNLINNAQEAIKSHREDGHLTISSELQGENILVRVTDNGPGLPPEAREHIFEPFFTTKKVEGAVGLGLSISYGIVSEYGGRIWVESEPGQGATFIVELPVAPGEGGPWSDEEDAPTSPVASKSILVIQNGGDKAASLRTLLSEDGHQVLLAQSNEAALEHLLGARDRGVNPDLIIAGLDLPGSDGIAFYDLLCREQPKLAGRLMFVTDAPLTSRASSFLRGVGLPYLTRPFTIRDLRRVMNRVLGG